MRGAATGKRACLDSAPRPRFLAFAADSVGTSDLATGAAGFGWGGASLLATGATGIDSGSGTAGCKDPGGFVLAIALRFDAARGLAGVGFFVDARALGFGDMGRRTRSLPLPRPVPGYRGQLFSAFLST